MPHSAHSRVSFDGETTRLAPDVIVREALASHCGAKRIAKHPVFIAVRITISTCQNDQQFAPLLLAVLVLRQG
jgi:hypothetical protein